MAYSYYDRRCVKYVVVTESWIRGEKAEEGGELNPTEAK